MNKKQLVAIIAMMLVVAMVSVAGTVAFLVSQTETVENTFTVGGVKITLDETDVDIYGDEDGDTRVTENDYKLIPGHEYTKDPIVHIAAETEPCYVFVEVINPIASIEAATTIENQMLANGWVKLAGVDNVWYYKDTVHNLSTDLEGGDPAVKKTDLPVFATFKLKDDAQLYDGEGDSLYTGEKIQVKAFAVQSDSFGSAAAAWTGAKFTQIVSGN